MADSVDALVYIGYLRSRWRFIVLSCAVALAVAGAVSLAERREYTATARVLIEPPAGADPRAAMAVSPVYLESLKTYEQFAASDSLFQKAAARFQLQGLTGIKAIESLKKRVLHVGLARNTRILEIAATLPDAPKAQALAQFLADEAVALNRSLGAQSGEELITAVEKQLREARAEVERDDTQWAGIATSEPVEDLRDAIAEITDLRAKLREQAGNARLEIADTSERATHASSREADLLRNELSNARARLNEIEREIEGYDRQIAADEKLLAQRQARRDDLAAKRAADQKALAAIESRLLETRNDLGYRGERLSLIDPGVVPERPSSPDIQLNLLAALFLGVLFPMIYLALSLNLKSHRESAGREVIEALARARHG
ncbi:MAG TPA: Wzz/FepE/Etk N-terminal domain-containing protein [Bryobacteraceae bacterium]|nr:Wzz/FepE/Etk N-terminal domain-containing protein [Bryobacteraceae bacterium]